MKNIGTSLIAIALLVVVALACSASTANLSSLKVSKDKAGTTEATSFKSGDTIYAKATVSNNPGKVTIKTYLTSKGETIKGSEVPVALDGDGVSEYSVPVSAALEPGSYTLTADMMNEAGEKKDSKSTSITIGE